MQIKVLSTHWRVLEQERYACDCNSSNGNFERDSYSAALSRAVSHVFQSIGIEFESRNYGMTAMPSVPDFAPCIDSDYGLDVDLLTWDFGQTEAGSFGNDHSLYIEPVSWTPTGQQLWAYRLVVLQQLSPGSVLAMDPNVMREIFRIPECLDFRNRRLKASCPWNEILNGRRRLNRDFHFALMKCTIHRSVLHEIAWECGIWEGRGWRKPGSCLELWLKFRDILSYRSYIDYYVNFTSLSRVTTEMLYTSRSLCHLEKLPGKRNWLGGKCFR